MKDPTGHIWLGSIIYSLVGVLLCFCIGGYVRNRSHDDNASEKENAQKKYENMW